MATTHSSDLSSSVGGIELQTFQHVDMKVDLSYSGCVISPDGKYVAGGSANGNIFVWRTSDGNLENQLDGHDGVGVVSVAWGRGGSNGQQFASVDKKGFLYLWA
jgi:autophagy-related protein 16